jgi:NAD(P)-dependent dehydrogenase (short-subunit alcohol dehydrogenase family)
VILSTGSSASLRGGTGGSAYPASKHGLVGLTRSIGWQYARHGIRCNLVVPGGILNHDPAAVQAVANPFGWSNVEPIVAAIPRMGDISEITPVVLFLASDAASYVNGAVIVADGGWSAG